MNKWEYAYINHSFQGVSSVVEAVHIVYMTATGKTSKKLETPDPNKAIAQLGLEGWEMISVRETISTYKQYYIYFFKRAITHE